MRQHSISKVSSHITFLKCRAGGKEKKKTHIYALRKLTRRPCNVLLKAPHILHHRGRLQRRGDAGHVNRAHGAGLGLGARHGAVQLALDARVRRQRRLRREVGRVVRPVPVPREVVRAHRHRDGRVGLLRAERAGGGLRGGAGEGEGRARGLVDRVDLGADAFGGDVGTGIIGLGRVSEGEDRRRGGWAGVGVRGEGGGGGSCGGACSESEGGECESGNHVGVLRLRCGLLSLPIWEVGDKIR